MLAALATLFCAVLIDPEPGPAIMAVVLCLSLSRSQLDRDLRGRLEAAAALPAVSLAALGAAILLHDLKWVGAAAFVAAVSLSIWLRRFGAAGRKAGALIALPFVVILVTPYVPSTRLGPAMALLLPVIVALLALFWVSLLDALACRLRVLPADENGLSAAMPEIAPTPSPGSTLRPIASTRMALQMATALAMSFVIGYAFFAERWAWIVLTAFIVNSGNQGRLDVVYKSVLRVLGAAAGTAIAVALSGRIGGHDASTVALMLLAVFLATWLRPLGYAWWALFITLALALLQGYTGISAAGLLGFRLEEIVLGAIIGVAASWFVLPVRSTDVLRRRIADALAALAEAFDPATPARNAQPFVAALAGVDKAMPPFRAARLLTRHSGRPQPADWADTLAACHAPALAIIESGQVPAGVRKALGAARKALRTPQTLGSALDELRREMLQGTA